MPKLYHCMDRFCENTLDLYTQGEALEHLRDKHIPFLSRPQGLGVADGHGHIWYCLKCETLLKDHKSFDSHNAVWDHLRSSHNHEIECIKVAT